MYKSFYLAILVILTSSCGSNYVHMSEDESLLYASCKTTLSQVKKNLLNAGYGISVDNESYLRTDWRRRDSKRVTDRSLPMYYQIKIRARKGWINWSRDFASSPSGEWSFHSALYKKAPYGQKEEQDLINSIICPVKKA